MVNGLLAKNGLIVTGSVEVQNAVTASIFSGDGSGLSGVSDFPYTGSAVISGSLEVTGSIISNGNVTFGNPTSPTNLTIYTDTFSGGKYLQIKGAGTEPEITSNNSVIRIYAGSSYALQLGDYAYNYLGAAVNIYGKGRASIFTTRATSGGDWRLYQKENGQFHLNPGGTDFNLVQTIPDSVMFQVDSTDMGVRFPRHSTTSRNSILTPVEGLLIYNTSSQTFNYYNSSSWAEISKDPFPYTGSAVISGSLDTKGGVTITGSNALAGNYALKVANSSGTNIITAENDGTVIVGTDSNYKLTVDGKLSKFGNTFQIDQTGGDRYLRLVNFNIVDSTYDLGITAQGISLNPGNNTLSLGGNTKSVHINKGGYSQTTIPNSNGVEMLFKPQQAGHVPQYSIIRGDDTSFQPTPIYIFGGANSNTTYTSAQTGSVILQYVPSVGARGNVGIGLEDPQTRLHVSGAIRSDILETNGTQRSLYTTQSFQYSGSNLTQITMSFENGGQEITNINYTGSNIDNIVISGSDGINKIYTLSYDGDGNVTNIIVS